MRGFQRSKIIVDGEERPALEGFDYIASLSGGNFANVLYSFAPGTTADELLDADGIGHPSEITKEELENVPAKSIFSLFQEPILPQVAYALLTSALFPHEGFWENFVYKRFLEPFGVSRYQPIGETRDEQVQATPLVMTSVVGPAELFPDYVFYEMNQELYPTILTKHLNLFESYNPYYFLAKNRSKSNEILWEIAEQISFHMPYGAFIAPDEFTIPMQEHVASFDKIGNMTVDPIDFLSVSSQPDDLIPEELMQPFTLTKMLAVGTDLITLAAGGLASVLPPDVMSLLLKPIVIDIPTANGSKRKMALSDGGYNTHNGFPSLVKKGVRKIICNLYATQNEVSYTSTSLYKVGATNLYRMFGVFSVYSGILYDANGIDQHVFDLYSNNENQIDKLWGMIDSLDRAGEPLIATLKDLDVVENKFWGIKGGGKVDVTFIFNIGVPKNFSDQVPREAAPPSEGMNFTDSYGLFTNPDVRYVPNLVHSQLGAEDINIPLLNTTIKNPLPIEFAISAENTRMTEILTSWMIEHAWDGLVGDDGEVKFEGFRKIFEED